MLHVSRHGDRGSELPALPTATVWRAGQEAEVTWQITANHGGGYQVTRDYTHVSTHTCPVPAVPRGPAADRGLLLEDSAAVQHGQAAAAVEQRHQVTRSYI